MNLAAHKKIVRSSCLAAAFDLGVVIKAGLAQAQASADGSNGKRQMCTVCKTLTA